MLSIFPTLLTYWLIAPVILRLGLGLTMVIRAYKNREVNAALSWLQIILGLLLLTGLFIQPVAALMVILAGWALRRPLNAETRYLLILQIAIGLSLLFLGPGFFALDRPL